MNQDATMKIATPYIGVRAYGIEDSKLFSGRDADVGSVTDLIADKDRWRLILLHGMTGAGKSSFLKAGLIPDVTAPEFGTAVFQRTGGDPSYSLFITSTGDPMSRLVEAAIELVEKALPADEIDGFYASLKLATGTDETQKSLARSAAGLANLFGALAPRLRRPLLLIIDQAEELFTSRSGGEADRGSECYFDFLAEFCSRSSWIQLLLSMRTEFYGRFDAELRRRLGPSAAIAPYFLRSLTTPILAQVILAPCEFTFEVEDGGRYRLIYEEGLPMRIAEDLTKFFPGPGALTSMQIVCSQLAERALKAHFAKHGASGSGSPPCQVEISQSMYDSMGPLTNTIEDLIDQTLGAYCSAMGLLGEDARCLWRAGKQMLGSLVAQKADGAPVTSFMLRDSFVTEMDRRLTDEIPRMTMKMFPMLYSFGGTQGNRSHIVEDAVKYLLAPHRRILRPLTVAGTNGAQPSEYVALGHDVLAVAIAEFNARSGWLDQKRNQKSKRSLKVLSLFTLIIAVIIFAVLSLLNFVDLITMSFSEILVRTLGPTIFGTYALVSYESTTVIRKIRSEEDLFAAVLRHQKIPVEPASNFLRFMQRLFGNMNTLKVLFSKLPNAGALFHEITNFERREYSSTGHTAFPGRPSF